MARILKSAEAFRALNTPTAEEVSELLIDVRDIQHYARASVLTEQEIQSFETLSKRFANEFLVILIPILI